jgi:AcrR family transcriptional regulator
MAVLLRAKAGVLDAKVAAIVARAVRRESEAGMAHPDKATPPTCHSTREDTQKYILGMTKPLYQPGGKRRQTKESLLEAADVLFAERGFHDTKLDDIAARSGMTKGAVYGNFKSKERLYLASLNRPLIGVRPSFVKGASFREQMRILGDAVVVFAPLADRRSVRMADLQLYLATHPERRRAFADFTDGMVARLVARWRPFFRQGDLPMPLREFVVMIDALIDGLMMQRAMTPAIVSDRLIRQTFLALAR